MKGLSIIIKKLNHNILIEVDISSINSFRGPGNFAKGIYYNLPITLSNCNFISSSYINLIFKRDFYFIPHPKFKENYFDKLRKKNIIDKYILGPIFVPKKWEAFPVMNDWKERRFAEILNLTKGIAVHSKRVLNYLAQRSNTTKNLHKFIIIRACSNLSPKRVNSFFKRKIDILFFEKYADLNRRKQGEQLFTLLKKTNKNIISIEYGFYNKKIIQKLANNSKFIIYFSFYDTGAIGLKEIQNYGVFAFTHQKDLVIDNETSFFVPELMNKENMKPAFYKIKKLMEIISSKNPDSYLIAKKNQMLNNCLNSLKDLCQNI